MTNQMTKNFPANFGKNFLPMAALLICAFYSQAANSFGIMVSPTRVEFDENERIKEVKLINKSDKQSTYRVSFQHLRMNEDGAYQEIDPNQPGQEKFVDNIVRYSPRQVTLEPGGIQVVRLMLRPGANLPAGEYRSHMLFREEAPSEFGNNIEKSNDNSNKISVTLRPLFGISIPVIVTYGKTEVKVKITKATVKNIAAKNQLTATNPVLNLTVERSGSASAFGDFSVTFTPAGTSKEYDVGTLNAVSVFAPYPKREVNINLAYPKGYSSASPGQLKVSFYKRKDEITDRNDVLAQSVINQ